MSGEAWRGVFKNKKRDGRYYWCNCLISPVSVGIVVFPDHGDTLYDLFKKVDASVYHAKEIGRNRSHVYRPEDLLLEKMNARIKWKGRIKKALKEDRCCISL